MSIPDEIYYFGGGLMSDAQLPKARYKVFVDDNFHYMDESERYRLGEYDTCDMAVEACKRTVDSFLLAEHKPSMAAEQLMQRYTSFGDDPFVVTLDGDCKFSAWSYAKQRCQEMCAEGDSPRGAGE